jgi:hypothetical protein
MIQVAEGVIIIITENSNTETSFIASLHGVLTTPSELWPQDINESVGACPPYRLNGANGERRRSERRQFQARTTSNDLQ